MQRGDDDERNRNGDRMRAGGREPPRQPRQQRLNQMRERRLADPAERQRRDRYAQLGGGEIGVEIVDRPLQGFRVAPSGGHELSHAAPANRDQ